MTEDEVLAFWKKNKIYEKVKKHNSGGEGFYMMDGPPYATGHIHMGTALNKILKDVAMRSQRLQGRDVFDRPGYDTHGLPIELQVEKEIGSKSKQDIESYGVKKFVDKCREYATRYIKVMNEEFKNLGVWMDWDNPYKTLDDGYIEGIWNVLKMAYDKKMLYLGKYPVHVCQRCATAVAYNEIIYKKQADKAVFVKFPVKGKKNTFLIIFTTTPWTLPANTGIMAHPDFTYAEIEARGERLIIAKDLVEARMKEFDVDYKIVKEFKGKELKDLEYENPLERHIKIKLNNKRKVVLAPRYVNIEEGTGLVHCAPGHGKEDYEVGVENGLDIVCPVGIDGTLTEEAGKYAGKKARAVDKEIVEDLKKDGFLVFEKNYEHEYPLCWRCKTPLLMLAQPQWFLKISTIHKKLLEENDKVNWNPKWAQARMKAWLEGISDWPISRERYWGTPLPIWECDKCEEIKVIGSVKELQTLSGKKKIGMHKPEIDDVTWKCSCKGTMSRTSSVLDVWFDSGATSWAALDYPSRKDLFKKFWPADLNIEGTDQFRGWWNSQLILSVFGFERRPYDNISVHGMVLDISRRKMSKSEGNAVAPEEVIKKYGRDQFRYYLTKLSKGEDFAYNEREFIEIKKIFMILLNVDNFVSQIDKGRKKLRVEDRWIISGYNSLIKEVKDYYNSFKFSSAIEQIERFLLEDLSRTYIQMTRERSSETRDVLEEIFTGILKLLAPVAPFVTESLWQKLLKNEVVKEESIHLSAFPDSNNRLIDAKLEKDFNVFIRVIENGLAERDKVKMGLKWPLAKAIIKAPFEMQKDMIEILKNQLNVKEVEAKNNKENAEISVHLDMRMTPELEGEGFAREIARKVQSERKNRGLEKKERVKLKLVVSEKLRKLLLPHTEFIKTRTGAEKLDFTDDKSSKIDFKVREESIGILF